MLGLRPRSNGGTIEVVEVEYPVHTPQNPYCGDLNCPECRTNVENHGAWTGAPTQDGRVNTSKLDSEVDDDWFEAAMTMLRGG